MQLYENKERQYERFLFFSIRGAFLNCWLIIQTATGGWQMCLPGLDVAKKIFLQWKKKEFEKSFWIDFHTFSGKLHLLKELKKKLFLNLFPNTFCQCSRCCKWKINRYQSLKRLTQTKCESKLFCCRIYSFWFHGSWLRTNFR